MRFLAFSLLFCFASARDFIFSADLFSSNHVIYYQNFSISPCMYKPSGKKHFICYIDPKTSPTQSEFEFLQKQKDKLLSCFISQNVKVQDSSLTTTKGSFANTNLVLEPVRFFLSLDANKSRVFVYAD